MNRSWLVLVCVLIFTAVSVCADWPALAQSNSSAHDDPCPPPKLRTNVRPNADGPPTEVLVGIRMLDLLDIDDVNQTLTIDFGILRTWTDSRLAHLEGCEISLDHVWYPELAARNSGRLFERWPREVSIGPEGRVQYIQRYYGTIASYHSLHEFPFDSQVITVQLIPLQWAEDEVKLVLNESFTGMVDSLNISDWIIESTEGEISRQFMVAFDRFHDRLDFKINAHRIRAYYVWKIILPLSLIVAMSWCVFWIDPAAFGTQLGLSATAMLTLIAFIFATTNMVPALGYFTLLDFFIGGATILVFLALLESLLTSYLVTLEKNNLAQRIDRVCRALFPLSFAGIAALVFIP